MHKSAMVGIFLAMLELTRHHNVQTEQDELHGEIWIVPADGFQQVLVLADDVDEYDPRLTARSGDPGSLVE